MNVICLVCLIFLMCLGHICIVEWFSTCCDTKSLVIMEIGDLTVLCRFSIQNRNSGPEGLLESSRLLID